MPYRGVCIGFVSGKGGTGKTSLLAGIGAALAQRGKRVLCVDCDALRGLDLAMSLTEQSFMDFADVAAGRASLPDAVAEHPRQPGLFFINAPASGGGDLGELAAHFDFCLFDAPPGLDDAFRLVLSAADSVLVVCGTDPLSRRDAQRVAMELDAFPSDAARLIVNGVRPSPFRAPAVTVDDIMDEVGLPLMGVVPHDFAFARALDKGLPVTLSEPDGAAARACVRIARRLTGEDIKIPRLCR